MLHHVYYTSFYSHLGPTAAKITTYADPTMPKSLTPAIQTSYKKYAWKNQYIF